MSCLTLAAIGLHLASLHSHKPSDPQYGPSYNNTNPGVYAQSECGITVGAYYNSIRKASIHAGYTLDFKHLPLFLSGGLATGYYSPIIPMGMAGIRFDSNGYRLRIGYIPKLSKLNDTHVVHLMIEKRF